ncbi:MAG: heterodisulfide reductase-related iron-sulfur binding cluster [Promethearchaeota archaeon]
MSSRKKYPTEEVEPENFLDNDEIKRLLETRDAYKFKQEDWIKLLNCVHCNECGTSEDRAALNEKFLKDGNEIPGLEQMSKNFLENGTPYKSNKMRIKRPEGIPSESDTLFFMGCLSTIKIPAFTQNALKYLLKRGIDFTILDEEICCGYPIYVSGAMDVYAKLEEKNVEIFKKYMEIICLCPACYFMFQEKYPDIGVKYSYISDYLEPAEERKSGRVSVQHLCQLKNRGHPEVAKIVDGVLEKSGYTIEPVPHWCCGGGIGYMHRTDVIDKIAMERMKDFRGDFFTTYCPGCYWIMKRFRMKGKVPAKLKDTFALLL